MKCTLHRKNKSKHSICARKTRCIQYDLDEVDGSTPAAEEPNAANVVGFPGADCRVTPRPSPRSMAGRRQREGGGGGPPCRVLSRLDKNVAALKEKKKTKNYPFSFFFPCLGRVSATRLVGVICNPSPRHPPPSLLRLAEPRLPSSPSRS